MPAHGPPLAGGPGLVQISGKLACGDSVNSSSSMPRASAKAWPRVPSTHIAVVSVQALCSSLTALRASEPIKTAQLCTMECLRPDLECLQLQNIGMPQAPMHAANCVYCMQAREQLALPLSPVLQAKLPRWPGAEMPWPGHLNALACCNFAGTPCLLQGQWEDRLASYFAHQIRTDPSPVYGEGFRAALDAFQEHGLPAVLQAVASTGRLP